MTKEEVLRRELPRYVGKIKVEWIRPDGIKEIRVDFTLSDLEFLIKSKKGKPILKRLTKEVVEEVLDERGYGKIKFLSFNDFGIWVKYELMGESFSTWFKSSGTFENSPMWFVNAIYEKGANICIDDSSVIYED